MMFLSRLLLSWILPCHMIWAFQVSHHHRELNTQLDAGRVSLYDGRDPAYRSLKHSGGEYDLLARFNKRNPEFSTVPGVRQPAGGGGGGGGNYENEWSYGGGSSRSRGGRSSYRQGWGNNGFYADDFAGPRGGGGPYHSEWNHQPYWNEGGMEWDTPPEWGPWNDMEPMMREEMEWGPRGGDWSY